MTERDNKKLDELIKLLQEDYEQAFVPDKIRLAEYLMRAKGENRTMASFAEECEASPSTFSRIVNRNISKPLSVRMIALIKLNAAPSAHFSIEELALANGLDSKENRDKQKLSERIIRRSEENEKTRRAIRNTIAEELYERGCTLRYYDRLPDDEELEKSRRFNRRILSTFAIQIQGIEPKYWNFYYRQMNYDIDDDDRRAWLFSKIWLNDNAIFFLRDQWEPETLRNIKNTFIFTDPELYGEITKRIGDVEVNNDISFILLDIEEQKLVEEAVLRRSDGQVHTSIFEMEKKTYGGDDNEL